MSSVMAEMLMTFWNLAKAFLHFICDFWFASIRAQEDDT